MLRLFLCLTLAGCGSVKKAADGGPGDGDGAPPGMQRLEVTVTGDGLVTSDPPGIECPETCTADFDDGVEVSLTAVPAGSTDLRDWTGDCTGFGACAVTMDASRTVEANFGLHGSKRWIDHISHPGQDFLSNDVVVDGEGNPIIAGEVEQTDGGWDLYVAKFDRLTGEPIWENQVATTPASMYYGGLTVDADGNAYAAMAILGFEPFMIAGQEVTPDLFGNIILLRLAAADGDIEWVKQWGGDGQDRPHAIAVSGANLYMVGYTSSSPSNFDGLMISGSTEDGFMAKARIDNGNAIRVKHFDGFYNLLTVAASETRIAVGGYFQGSLTIDGGCDLAGAGSNSYDGFVAQFLQSDLDCQWARDFGDPANDLRADASGIAAYPGGGWVATGSFQGSVLFADAGPTLDSSGSYDAFAVRYAGNGDHVWSSRHGDTGFDIGRAIATTADGATIFTGYFESAIAFGDFDLTGAQDVYVTRMSPGTTPSHEWAVALGGDDRDWAEGLAVDASGYPYVLAYFMGMTNVDGEVMTALEYDAWLGALIR